LNRKDLNYTRYTAIDPIISKAERVRDKQVDDLGDVALTTIENLCILPATQEIVNRRTSAVARVAALKNPSTPFGGLLYDIFDNTSAYISGQKSISNDWEKIVDGDLYISEIIKIAIYARLFYESVKCFKAPPALEEEPAPGPGGEPAPGPGGEPGPKPPKTPIRLGGRRGSIKLSNATAQGIGNVANSINGSGNTVTNNITIYSNGNIGVAAANGTTQTVVVPEKTPRLEKSSLILNTDSTFSLMVESLLNEALGVPTGISSASIKTGVSNTAEYLKSIPTNIINYFRQIKKDSEFMDFVKRGIIFVHDCEAEGNPVKADEKGNPMYVTDETGTKPKIFTLKVIKEMSATNQSAKDLINIFAKVAQYQRSASGVIDKASAAGQAGAAIAKAGGVGPLL